jgi:hypothetical protein
MHREHAMGKKSDKFMNDITALIANCQDPLTLTVKAVCDMEVNLNAQKKLIEKRAYDELQEGMIEQTTIAKKGKAAANELRTSLTALKKKVAEFKEYVDKKANSKNPFTSKQSVPASKAFILNAEDIIAEAEKYAGRFK